jgi:16S rRNA (uracil1498-N3)-methyltransferase
MRFYDSQLWDSSANSLVRLEGRAAHHLAVVLRVKVGQFLHLFNETMGEWNAQIVQIQKGPVVTAKVLEPILPPRLLRPLHLAFGIPKWEACHFILEKGTELGVTHFYPLILEHCQNRQLNLLKSQSVLIDAVQQCGRQDCPHLASPQTLSNWLDSHDSSIGWFWAQERSKQPSLLERIQSANSKDQPIGILVGPEGGFSKREQEQLGGVPVYSLGPLILRTETSALASLAITQAKL